MSVVVPTARYSSVCAAEPLASLAIPLALSFRVARGFGRGGKQLGVPTANVDPAVVETVDPSALGVFAGWARLDGVVYKCVASIGWNPFFRNERKAIEPHLIGYRGPDFYDRPMGLLLCAYVRPERDFSSLDALRHAIFLDIASAETALDEPRFGSHREQCPS